MLKTKDEKALEFVGTFKPVEEMPEIEEEIENIWKRCKFDYYEKGE